MALTFYPHSDDAQKGTLDERLETLMEAAETYRAVVVDTGTSVVKADPTGRGASPRDLTVAFNWEGITRVLREVRELAEINKTDKIRKAALLGKLSEIYEVLRAAKMSKLEAVRLALISEANQLRGSGGANQVA